MRKCKSQHFQGCLISLKIHVYSIITDSVVLWKIQKFDWLIPETK